MSVRWRIVEALSPLLRALPPWQRVRVYARLCGSPFALGGFDGRIMRRRVAPHDFLMALRLDDWMERMAAFTGLFYEVEATATLQRLLSPGDIFVDVGANVGFLTLTASKLVGATGRVIAVEPNIHLVRRLQDAVAANEICNATILPCAFGAAEGKGSLSVETHEGVGTLRSASEEGLAVDIAPGDAIGAQIDSQAHCLIKIDVEGYEQKVLDGMKALRARDRTSFLIEITDEWLKANGGGADEIFQMMKADGYQAYRPILSSISRFRLVRIDAPIANMHQYDVVFMRP